MGWKEQGRCVRKGEKAIVLCMPITQVWNDRRGVEPIPERSAQRIFKATDQILKVGTEERSEPTADR